MRLPFGPHRRIDVFAAPRIAIAVALTAATLTGASQSPATNHDPVIGQWRLDVSKSKYTPGPGPKSETRTYQSTGEGIRAVIVRTHQNGRVETIEYGADYDSVNHVPIITRAERVPRTPCSPKVLRTTAVLDSENRAPSHTDSIHPRSSRRRPTP